MAKKQRGKQRTGLPFGKKALILVLCAVVLALTAVCLRAFSSTASPFPRLEVAGLRITQEEYLRAMYQARNDVLSDHAAAGISLTDWSAETALGDPCELTTQRALELLTEYYAVSTLAVERGYLADAGYAAMKRDMEQINLLRQEALDSGAVVTGLPQFTVEDYLTYRASSIRLQFCEDPDNPENQVTPEEVRQRYEADRDSLYQQPDSMELIFLLADAEPGEADDLQQAFESLRQRALEREDLSAALEEFPELKAYYQEISVTSGTYSVYARSHGDVLAWAADLQTGELSQVFRQEDRLCLIQCLQRTVLQYASLETVESIVIQSIRESRYEALIAARMEEIELQGDLDALYRFTAEQFR